VADDKAVVAALKSLVLECQVIQQVQTPLVVQVQVQALPEEAQNHTEQAEMVQRTLVAELMSYLVSLAFQVALVYVQKYGVVSVLFVEAWE
jgi:hypothetical protein